MSASAHIFGEDARVEIECDGEDSTIWVRARDQRVSVSMTLEPAQLDALEAAIASARKVLAVAS